MQPHKTKTLPEGKVELLAWTENSHKKGDPSVRAVLHGGNVGHAAVRIVIPAETIDNNPALKDKLNSFKEATKVQGEELVRRIDANYAVGNERVILPSYEIYFSFWNTDADQPNILQTPEQDKEAEWEGRKSPPLDRRKAKELMNIDDQQLEQMVKQDQSKANRGYFDIMHILQIQKQKIVYSGIKEIWHINPYEVLADLEQSLLNSAKLIENKIKVLQEYHHDPEQLDILKINLGFTKNHLNKLHYLRDRVAIDQTWDEKSLRSLEDLLNRYIDHLKKEEPDEEKKIARFEEQVRKINDQNYRTIGLEPTKTTTFSTKEFELGEMLDGLTKMAQQNYTALGWNCSSTALYVLMQGLPEALKRDKKIAYYMKKLQGREPKKLAIFTPQKVEQIARMLQEKHIAYIQAQVASTQIKQREKELTEVTQAMHKPAARPTVFALFHSSENNTAKQNHAPTALFSSAKKVKMSNKIAEKDKPSSSGSTRGRNR